VVAIALAKTTTTVRETERKYSGEPVDVELAGALATAAADHGVQGRPREPARPVGRLLRHRGPAAARSGRPRVCPP